MPPDCRKGQTPVTGPDRPQVRTSQPSLAVDYERVFEIQSGLAALHEHLVRRLDPRVGQRWLDIATGTGRVARMAARAHADVTAQDVSPTMIESARRLAGEEGLNIQFDVDDCRALPYADGSFDVVASAVGLIFAPDHEAVARELTRVCRRGGTIGIVAWRPDPDFKRIFEPFAEAPRAGGGDYSGWGREEHVRDLLGHTFDLTFEDGDTPIAGQSGAAIWEVWLRSIESTRAHFDSLEPDRRSQLRDAFVTYFEGFRGPGGIEQPNPYLLTLGRRR